jgi:hypothetical protein
MTTSLSAAALRMPITASVAAPAPLALGAPAEPCAAKPSAGLPADWPCGVDFGGIIAPAFGGRQGGTDGGDRFGGSASLSVGGAWHRQDWAQFAGGGPLRG